MKIQSNFASSAKSFDWFLERIEVAEWKDRTPGKRDVMAACPVHGGSDSLHVSEKADGNGEVYCFACEAKYGAVVAALEDASEDAGRLESDESSEDASSSVPTIRRLRPMEWWAGYTGVDESIWRAHGVDVVGDAVAFTFGDLDARKLRRPPTSDKKGITWSGRLRPPIWPLPGDAVEPEVHLCVSESDCGALLACGFQAFALTKGDRGTGELFHSVKAMKQRGGEYFVVWTDADPSGRSARDAIVIAVQSVGLPVVYPDLDALADPLTGEKDVNDIYRRLGPDALVKAARFALVDVPEPARTLTHAEMLAAGKAQIDFRVMDLIGPGDKVGIIGPYKSRKTFLALDLARALAVGGRFAGLDSWSVPRPFRVMVVEEEGSRQRFGKRVSALVEIPADTDAIRWKHRTGFDFTEEARVAALVEEMRAHATDVVIFDPFQRMSGQGEENSATAMKPAWDAVARMQAAIPDLVVVILFHTRKEDSLTLDSIRGSGRHAGELDVALMIRKEDLDHSLLTVEGRDVPAVGNEGEAMRVRFDYEPEVRLDLSIAGVATIKIRRVKSEDRLDEIRALGPVITREQVMSALGIKDRQARGYIGRLVEEGEYSEVFAPDGTKTWRQAHAGLAVGTGLEPGVPANPSRNVNGSAGGSATGVPMPMPTSPPHIRGDREKER